MGFGDQGIRTFDTAYVFQFRANLTGIISCYATPTLKYLCAHTDAGGLELAEIGTVELKNFNFSYVPQENEASVWQGTFGM